MTIKSMKVRKDRSYACAICGKKFKHEKEGMMIEHKHETKGLWVPICSDKCKSDLKKEKIDAPAE